MTRKSLVRLSILFALLMFPLITLAQGISEVDRQRMLEGSYIEYIWRGAAT